MSELSEKRKAIEWAWSKLHALLYNSADAKKILSEFYEKAIENEIGERRTCDVVRSGEREWINAKNRRPEKDNGRFLVFNGAVVFEMSYNIQFGGWHTPSGVSYKGITHWMELPEPPASH